MPQVYNALKHERHHKKRYSPVFHQLNAQRSHASWRSFAITPPDVKFETQEPDEEIILFLRQHPVVNLGWIFMTFLMLSLPAFWEFLPVNWLPIRFQFMTIIGWYLLVLAFVLERFLNWYFNVYIVTDERVVDIDFEGLIYRHLSVTQLNNIEDVTFSQSGPASTLFNYGDVFIQTAAEQREFDFRRVPRPTRVVEILYMLQQEEELENLQGRVK